ncbi:MAG: hypothetical protein PHO66_06710 [Eubacteriales bacterium]|nr:hypothetical protein [Eubacteriales bacterium]
MFFFSHILRNIARNAARSLLLVCISVLLLCFLGAYFKNIERNESALANVAQAIPVSVQISNKDGSAQNGLAIRTARLDALLSAAIKDPVYTALAAGNLSPEHRTEPVQTCDTALVAANNISAFASLTAADIDFVPGVDESFLAGDAAHCIVAESYAAQHGIGLGDALSFPLYVHQYNDDGFSFSFYPAGEAALQVVGIYHESLSGAGAVSHDMLVPVAWLRAQVEGSGGQFTYDSALCRVADPLQLNAFKADMKSKYFTEISDGARDLLSGNSLIIHDKAFVEVATNIGGSLALYRRFLLPVFAMVTLLCVLVLFLFLRNRRYDIAVANSLGQPKLVCGLSLFVEVLLLALCACAVAAGALRGAAGFGWPLIAKITAGFLVCAGAGSAVALAGLLRVNTLDLLTKMD